MKRELETKIETEKSRKLRRPKENNAVKKRVGRPRKYPLQQQPSVQGHIPRTTNPKRRGRPPKGVSRQTASSFNSHTDQRRSPRLEPKREGQKPCDSNEISESKNIDTNRPMTVIPIPSPLMTKQYNFRKRL